MNAEAIQVLLIEDSPSEARLIQETLAEAKQFSFSVERADRLSSGLARLASGGIQVVLLDLSLPDSQGLETLDTVHAKGPGVPIVVLTGLDDVMVGAEAVKRGAQDYLVKGFPEGQLVARALCYAIERHRMSEELECARLQQLRQQERLNRELEAQNKDLEEFAYVASHDLREPLRKIISFGGLLRRDLGGNLPDRAARDLKFIIEAAERMRRLVEDLLSLSRASRGQADRERFSLDECADAALSALHTTIEETGALIERDPLPELWAERTPITQLYQNLIANALKFVDGRRPHIRLTARKEGEEWILGVADNGIGINPEYAEQIFSPFQRLNSREEYDGSGIGLAICRKTVERHGGKIWVESDPGVGSHFKFYLAQRRAERA